MAIRKIIIPEPVKLVDIGTSKPFVGAESTIDFRSYVVLLLSNPLWCETSKAMLAQASVLRALPTNGEAEMLIAEEDWELLSAAAATPRTAIMPQGGGMQVMPGLGYHPSVSAQLVPLMLAITKAEVA